MSWKVRDMCFRCILCMRVGDLECGWGLDAPAHPSATILWPRVTCCGGCGGLMIDLAERLTFSAPVVSRTTFNWATGLFPIYFLGSGPSLKLLPLSQNSSPWVPNPSIVAQFEAKAKDIAPYYFQSAKASVFGLHHLFLKFTYTVFGSDCEMQNHYSS